MWPFSNKKIDTPVKELPGETFHYVGQDIFDIIALGLKSMRLSPYRGSMNIVREKYGDGNYHLRGRYEPIPEKDNGLRILVDGVSLSKTAWNAMSDEERFDMCKNHTVSIVTKEITDEI